MSERDCKSNVLSRVDETANVEAIIRKLDHQSQFDLLLEILQSDSHWHDVVVHRFGKLSDGQIKAHFVSDIYDAMTITYSGYDSGYDFFDYDDFFYPVNELKECMTKHIDPFIECGAYSTALQLIFTFQLTMLKLTDEESEGLFSNMLDSSNKYFETLFTVNDPAIKPTFFRWLCEVACINEEACDANAILDDGMDNIVVGDFTDDVYNLWEFQNNARKLIDKYFVNDVQYSAKVEMLAQNMLIEDTRAFYESLPFYREPVSQIAWAVVKLHCMQVLGSSFQEMLDFADGQPPSYQISCILVDIAREHGDDDKAIQLLENLISYLRDRSYYPTEAALQLLDILKEHGLKKEVDKLYLDLIVNDAARNDDQLSDWIRDARKNAGDNWPNLEDEIIGQLGQDRNRLQAFYAATENVDDLMETIRSDGSTDELFRYEYILANRFPDVYLSEYEAIIRETLFGEPAQRKVYRYGVELLSSLNKIPGGTDVVNQIVNELRSAYPKRKALMEELNRLG